MPRPIQAYLDQNALQNNLHIARRATRSRVMAVVKANGYGHGLLQVAEALSEADGFALLDIQDAVALREAGYRQTILLLEGFFEAGDLERVAQYDLTCVIHSDWQIALLDGWPGRSTLDVWLKVNSGMNRLGLRPVEALKAWRVLAQSPAVKTRGLLTHFATADELDSRQTVQQLGRFRALQQALAEADGVPVSDSLANSAAIFAHAAAAGAWMRPGIALYGSSPFAHRSAESLGLRPVMTLRSRVIAVHTVPAGEAVGYGASWVAARDTRIAVVAIGYGDGYPRHAPSGTPVLINGQRCQLAGRVSMDMITVDLGQVTARPGDPVVLWGDGLPADEVASAAGTISYELFCRLTPRVQRHLLADEILNG